jgi:very-short-patch-repair endonuclease
MKPKQSATGKDKTKSKRTGMKAEAIIYFEINILNKAPLKNYNFERLKYIDDQITDFHCEELKAAIDIIPSSGKRNMNEEVNKNLKHQKFQKFGYKVFTFTDEEILNKPNKVKEILNDLVKPQPASLSFNYPGFTFTDDGLL